MNSIKRRRELRTQDGPSYAAMPGSMFGESYHGTCPACAESGGGK